MKQPTAHEQHLAEAQAIMAAALRAKTGPQRLAIADGMWRSARRMIQHYLRESHPDWSEAQLTRGIARRMSHGAV